MGACSKLPGHPGVRPAGETTADEIAFHRLAVERRPR